MLSKQTIAHYHLDPPLWWVVLTWPLSVLYGVAAWLRNTLYDHNILRSTKVNVPVISVGNLTTGGTGKTPVILALAKHFASQAKKVVILSRGYGAKTPLTYGVPRNPEHGDEAFALHTTLKAWAQEAQCPAPIVIVGKNRRKNAKRAVAEHTPDVILLDDGFQHRTLARDVDIVLVDGQSGFGNNHHLPTGPRREPLSSLKRADQVWITKIPNTTLAETLQHLSGKNTTLVPFAPTRWINPLAQETDEHAVDLRILYERPVLAVCGIAQPQGLTQMLNALNVNLLETLVFADHHRYSEKDWRQKIEPLWQRYSHLRPALVTTTKDWPKLCQVLAPHVKAQSYLLDVEPIIPQDVLEVLDATLV